MRPSPNATPLGPTLGLSNLCCHLTWPVVRSSATTLELRSWRYTVPLRLIGVEANAPKPLAPLKAKVHLTFSRDTVWALIGVCVVARLFARSWLNAGHAPALAAHSAGAWPTAADAWPPVTASATAAVLTAAIAVGRVDQRSLVFVGGMSLVTQPVDRCRAPSPRSARRVRQTGRLCRSAALGVGRQGREVLHGESLGVRPVTTPAGSCAPRIRPGRARRSVRRHRAGTRCRRLRAASHRPRRRRRRCRMPAPRRRG